MRSAARAIIVGGRGPVLDLDFRSGALDPRLTFSRASGATDLRYTDPAGASYNTYASDAPRFLSTGWLQEQSRTNRLFFSTAPVSRTTSSLSANTYTLWVNGTGTATSSAGTATGTGFGVASQGSPNTFTLTGAGTVNVTVAGSLNAFQLENGPDPTSLIVTSGAAATRATEICWMPIWVSSSFAMALTMAPGEAPGVVTGAARPAVSIGIADGSQRIVIRGSSEATYYEAALTGIAGGSVGNGGNFSQNQFMTIAASFKNGQALQITDGGETITVASEPIPDLTHLVFGANNSAGSQANWRGIISRFRLWRPGLSEARLRSLFS